MPWPPPMHNVTMPRLRSSRRIEYAVRERMRTPARYCHNDVAFRITGMMRGEHPRNRLTGHDIAELHRRGV